MARQHITYQPLDRPDVEVDVDGVWCPGELRMQVQDDDGTWSLQVQYRPPGDTSSHIVTVPADQVRADTVDRAAGRGTRAD